MNERVGATDDDRKLPSGADVSDDGAGFGTELGGGQLALNGVHFAEEVVGNVVPLIERDLVGGDVEASVYLHLVGVDDF